MVTMIRIAHLKRQIYFPLTQLILHYNMLSNNIKQSSGANLSRQHVSAAVVRPKHKADGTPSFSTPYRIYDT